MMKQIPRWKVRNLTLTGLFMAMGIVLPIAFHLFGGVGPKLLPMQLPVLLAGYFLCPQYAAAVGVITPVLSGLMTGMPPVFPVMPCLAVEFGAYALMLSILRFKSHYLRLLIALVSGKIILLLFALINPAFWTFATAQLTNGILGMIWQIVLVPVIVKSCEKGMHYVNRTSKV